MEKDTLMDDSDTESDREVEKKISSIFEDAYASTYISDDGKKRWRCEYGARRTSLGGMQLRRCSILCKKKG